MKRKRYDDKELSNASKGILALIVAALMLFEIGRWVWFLVFN